MNDATPERRRARNRGTLERRIAPAALDVSHAIMRGENYSEYLLDPLYRLFDADAGVGLITRRPTSLDEATRLTVAVAGTPPVSKGQAIRARPFLERHPGFQTMARLGPTSSIRL